MFRGWMPAITLSIFGVGIGIGFAWSYGLIPLTLEPVNSGKLRDEVTERETLPPPPNPWNARENRLVQTASIEAPDDGFGIAPPQTEPEPVDEVVPSSGRFTPTKPAQADEWSSSSSHENVQQEVSEEPSSKSPVKLRKRDRNPVRLDPNARLEEPAEPVVERKVKTIAHQDTQADEKVVSKPEEESEGQKSPAEQLAEAEELLATGETLKAHRQLSRLYWDHKEFRPRLQEIIDSTAQAIFFQPKPHYVEAYVIEKGDRLEAVAKKYNLSWEYVAKLNRTEPRRIQIGQKLKVMKGPFGAVVELRDYTLTVHLQGYYVKQYKVGIGKENSSPLGKFTVLEKLVDPQYTDSQTGKVIEGGDPANPLGKRWIDIGDHYGIHGTIDPTSIGKSESRGCIRMNDADIIEVYDFLVKTSEVVIRK